MRFTVPTAFRYFCCYYFSFFFLFNRFFLEVVRIVWWKSLPNNHQTLHVHGKILYNFWGYDSFQMMENFTSIWSRNIERRKHHFSFYMFEYDIFFISIRLSKNCKLTKKCSSWRNKTILFMYFGIFPSIFYFTRFNDERDTVICLSI